MIFEFIPYSAVHWPASQAGAPERNEAIDHIARSGKQDWKEQSDYHRRSLVENLMYRFKTLTGDRLWARDVDVQDAEVAVRVNEIRLLYRHIDILQAQYTRAKDIVAGLRRIQADTANEPFFDELKDAGFFIPNKYGTSAPVLPGSQDSHPRHETGPLVAHA